MVRFLSFGFLKLGEELIELVVALVPEALVLGQPGRRLAQWLGLEVADPRRCAPAARDQASLLEHLKVAGDGRLRHPERGRQRGDRCVSQRQPGEDGATRGIRQRGEDRVEIGCHL